MHASAARPLTGAPRHHSVVTTLTTARDTRVKVFTIVCAKYIMSSVSAIRLCG